MKSRKQTKPRLVLPRLFLPCRVKYYWNVNIIKVAIFRNSEMSKNCVLNCLIFILSSLTSFSQNVGLPVCTIKYPAHTLMTVWVLSSDVVPVTILPVPFNDTQRIYSSYSSPRITQTALFSLDCQFWCKMKRVSPSAQKMVSKTWDSMNSITYLTRKKTSYLERSE